MGWEENVQRPQALGLMALLCLTASGVSAAQAQDNSKQSAQAQEAARKAQQAEREAEAARQQAEAAQEEVRKHLQAEREAAEKKAQEEKKEEERRAEATRKKEEEEKKKRRSGSEPKLNIPIRYFVYSAVFGGLGYATGLLSEGPERKLRDPANHPTQDETLKLYRQARYGGILSKSFYGLSGAMGGYAAYKTQTAIREYLTAKAQMAALQQEADQRLAQASSPEERQAAEVTNALLVPPGPAATELLVIVPEPPPLQAGFIVGPAGDASVSLSVRF